MDDVRTQVLSRPGEGGGKSRFLSSHQVSIVVVGGGCQGDEHLLKDRVISLGRGPGVDLAFDDSSMSRQHAVLELAESGFRIRDLGSTNGVRVNDKAVQAAELKHGDRFSLGEHTFQYVVESREPTTPTYRLPES